MWRDGKLVWKNIQPINHENVFPFCSRKQDEERFEFKHDSRLSFSWVNYVHRRNFSYNYCADYGISQDSRSYKKVISSNCGSRQYKKIHVMIYYNSIQQTNLNLIWSVRKHWGNTLNCLLWRRHNSWFTRKIQKKIGLLVLLWTMDTAQSIRSSFSLRRRTIYTCV